MCSQNALPPLWEQLSFFNGVFLRDLDNFSHWQSNNSTNLKIPVYILHSAGLLQRGRKGRKSSLEEEVPPAPLLSFVTQEAEHPWSKILVWLSEYFTSLYNTKLSKIQILFIYSYCFGHHKECMPLVILSLLSLSVLIFYGNLWRKLYFYSCVVQFSAVGNIEAFLQTRMLNMYILLSLVYIVHLLWTNKKCKFIVIVYFWSLLFLPSANFT